MDWIEAIGAWFVSAWTGIVTAFGWLFGSLTQTQWDSWRNWLTTTGGLAALFVAVNTYRRNVRIKREEQARLVFSRMTNLRLHPIGGQFDLLPDDAQESLDVGDREVLPNPDPTSSTKVVAMAVEPRLQATVTIHNGSKELIGPVRVEMVDRVAGTIDTFNIVTDLVAPESDHVVVFSWPNSRHPGLPSLGTSVLFRDASGQWWRRHLAEPIEQVHDDPENIAGPPAARAVQSADAQRRGYPPIPDPIVTWRVQRKRWLRRRRGKPSLP